MLRYVVGDSIYRKCITKYLEKHAYGMVDTHDFYRAFMETAGINLDWFFEEWIYKSGVPEFTVAYQTDSNAVRVFVAQTHKKDSLIKDFRMPVDIEVYAKNGDKIKQSFLISRTQDTFSIPLQANTQTEFVVFDPGYNVLKTLKFQRSYNELIAQAAKGKNMIDRYLAIVALKDTAVARKQSDFIKLYETKKRFISNKKLLHS
jgi:aminopeptidase N